MFDIDPDDADAQLKSGEAWDRFCDLLKASGQVVLRDDTPDDPRVRAEGVRYLTRLLRAGLETFVEHADPMAPTLMRVVHETAKIGNDNPDNVYLNAAIEGVATYRLWGTRGTVHWLEFATQHGSYGESRGMPPTGHLDGGDLVVGDDGRFELWIGPERPEDAANWLPTTPQSGTLIIRQSWLDRSTEVLPELHLERVGGRTVPAPLTPATMVTGLMRAGMLVGGASAIFADWRKGFEAHVNQLPRFDQATSDAMGGVPHIVYHHSAWRLAPDEALLITAPHLACDHWNMQVSNPWLESLDYRHHTIHLNSKTAAYEDDGSIRVIVAHDDPGHPNWLTTTGLPEGAMCWRWVQPEADDPPEPTCRVVTLASLKG